MLEYLLLRPADSPLFSCIDADAWRFLILDEAHQYRGTKGTEMAMLVRRLKSRLRLEGKQGEFRCIATSASLLNKEGSKGKVSDFASELFDVPFDESHILTEECEDIEVSPDGLLSLDAYSRLQAYLDSPSITTLAAAHEACNSTAVLEADGLPPAALAGAWLMRDSRVAKLKKALETPQEVNTVADQCFADLKLSDERTRSLAQFVSLLSNTVDPKSGAPLISARYHSFVRTLESVYISFWPERRIVLSGDDAKPEGALFEVALCKECGQHYLVGQIRDGVFVEALRDPGHSDFKVTYLRPLENDYQVDKEESNLTILKFCVRCGAISQDKPNCGHNEVIAVVKETSKPGAKADQILRCSACGYHASGNDPVRELVQGNDGPNAVIATALIQALPSRQRKILAFTDGRQQAAFFAWYLDRSYQDLLNRNKILSVLATTAEASEGGLSLQSLADVAFYNGCVEYRV